MVTAAAGHFRTRPLARKASLGLGVMQEPTKVISRHENTRTAVKGQRAERG